MCWYLSNPINREHVSVKFRGQMKSTFRGCKGGDVCDPVITVRVDNVGAILKAGNDPVMNCNRHVDVSCKYVNEYIEDWIVKVVFVKSTENGSNILTMNLVVNIMRSTQGK